MTELPPITPGERLPLARRKDGRRWWIALAFALCLHGAAAAALLSYWRADEDQVAGAPLIMIELAALPVAPDVAPSDAPPGPQQADAAANSPQQDVAKRDTESVPEKSETTETAVPPSAPHAEQTTAAISPEPQAEVPAAAPAPPKTAAPPQPNPPSRAQVASAPSTTQRHAARTAAPAPAASRDSAALPNWKSALLNRLDRYKRYPPDAQARGERGVAQLAFSVDRGGGVHHARIVRSSGSSALDRATLSLIERAQPLPPPPADMRGAQIAVVVPIRYNIR